MHRQTHRICHLLVSRPRTAFTSIYSDCIRSTTSLGHKFYQFICRNWTAHNNLYPNGLATLLPHLINKIKQCRYIMKLMVTVGRIHALPWCNTPNFRDFGSHFCAFDMTATNFSSLRQFQFKHSHLRIGSFFPKMIPAKIPILIPYTK